MLDKNYQKAASVCPDGCDPSMVMHLIPGDPRVNLANAYCRCIRCLTYWEVTPLGSVVNTRWGIESKNKARLEAEKQKSDKILSKVSEP